jgi:Protein of unknown function (DUF998)
MGRYGYLQTAAFFAVGGSSLALAVDILETTKGSWGSRIGSAFLGLYGLGGVLVGIFPTKALRKARNVSPASTAVTIIVENALQNGSLPGSRSAGDICSGGRYQATIPTARESCKLLYYRWRGRCWRYFATPIEDIALYFRDLAGALWLRWQRPQQRRDRCPGQHACRLAQRRACGSRSRGRLGDDAPALREALIDLVAQRTPGRSTACTRFYGTSSPAE